MERWLALASGSSRITIVFIGDNLRWAHIGYYESIFSGYMNELDASAWMIGATVAVSALPEIPIMSYAETFIRKWGLRLTYVIGIIALPIRWLCNMLVTDPNIALPVQALHGIAIGSLLCVGVIYIDNILPKTWRASGQALYVSSLHGLGPVSYTHLTLPTNREV